MVSGFLFFKAPASAAVSCTGVDGSGNPLPDASCLGICQNATATNKTLTTQAGCQQPSKWYATANNSQVNTAAQQNAAKQGDETELEKSLDACNNLLNFTVKGCFQHLSYVLFVTLPSFLLSYIAMFFNFVTALTLSSDMYEKGFIVTIWRIIRDLSNIFFILILLYAAIQIILDLGHGGAKKIVASVIMVALLVNFSLFFTKVVIDASNIVALVFYNKIDSSNAGSYVPTGNTMKTKEKNLGGALVSAFNPNQFFSGKFFKDVSSDPTLPPGGLSTFYKIGLMLVYGMITYMLVYAFLIAGLSMFGRMLTLMLLMIISPIAFVSRAVPSLEHKETIGFSDWFSKLLTTSFVAAIFMFIIYVIAEILRADVFNTVADKTNPGALGKIVVFFMPAILIIILLQKGTKYAQSASGQFTGMVISGAKAIGAIGVGGAALGIAAAGRGTVGSVAKNIQNNNSRSKDLQFTELRSAVKEIKGINTINPFAYAKVATKAITGTGKFASAGIAEMVHKTPLGSKMKAADEGYSKVQSSVAALDAAAAHEFGGKMGYDKDVKYKDLTEHERTEVREEVDKDTIAKKAFGKSFANLGAEASQSVINAWKNMTPNPDGTISFNVASKDAAGVVTTQNYNNVEGADKKVEYAGQSKAVGEFVQALRKGSYDIRNLPEAKASGGTLSKIGVGTLSTLAVGMRALIKSYGVEKYGTSKRDVLEDIKSTLKDALGNINIKVDVVGSAGGKGGGDNHGGGGGHH